MAKVWKSEATRDEDIPLPVAMNDVFNTENEKDGSWRDADARLSALIKNQPDDDELKLMYATHLHSKYVLLGPELFIKGADTCPADQTEIERLVLETLPFAQNRPVVRECRAPRKHDARAGGPVAKAFRHQCPDR